MFGDDFNDGWPGVKNDVKKFCQLYKQNVIVKGKVWFIKKSKPISILRLMIYT